MDEEDRNDEKNAAPKDSGAVGAADPDGSVLLLQSGTTCADDPDGSATRCLLAAEDGAADRKPQDGHVTANPFRLQIYDPVDLHRAIRGISGDCDDDNYVGMEDERPRDIEAHLSNEETLRLRRLRQLASDRRGPWRSLIRGTPAMLERLVAIRRKAEHFAPFVELVARAVHVAIATDTPLRLPPIVLVGEPGIGKTWVLKQVAAAIETSASVLAMNMTDAFRIRGLNSAWRGARMGKVAELLLAADTESPIVLLDELEKTPGLDRLDRPFDVWHSLFEVENATAFVDDYLELPLRCDRILWIASANSIEPLPDSILDRLIILPIPPPDPDQVRAIIEGLYKALRERLGGTLADELAPDVREALVRHTPRRASRVLDLAIGFMAADRRMALSTADVMRATRLADAERDRPGRSIGFLSHRR